MIIKLKGTRMATPLGFAPRHQPGHHSTLLPLFSTKMTHFLAIFKILFQTERASLFVTI